MDTSGRIYLPKDDEEGPSREDTARLDGYLRGRAEADQKALLDEEVQRLRETAKRFNEQVSQAPKVVVDTEAARIRVCARLRQATWEATQFLSDDQVREYVSDVLREVESDAP